MIPATVQDVLAIVDDVAREVARWSPLDVDDIRSALQAVVARRTPDYITMLDEGRASRVAQWLRSEAGKLVRTEQVRQQQATGQYVYDPKYVRLFLPFFFDRQDWSNGPVPIDHRDRWSTTEAIDTAIDIAAAWVAVKDWQQEIMVARHVMLRPYGDRPDWPGIADATGRISGEAAERAYHRATEDLVIGMNRSRAQRGTDRDGPGARKATSNRAANARANDE